VLAAGGEAEFAEAGAAGIAAHTIIVKVASATVNTWRILCSRRIPVSRVLVTIAIYSSDVWHHIKLPVAV
jgi:hypothetical protein